MLDFLAAIANAGIEPVSLAAGIAIGFLFHRDWKQLAWPLLLFIVPGMGGLESPAHGHGAMYLGAADFIAVCLLTYLSFQVFEYFATRRPAKPRS
jgi:hypothetical protein